MCRSGTIALLVAACLLGAAPAASSLPASYEVPDEMPEAEQLVEEMDDALTAIEVAPDGTVYFAKIKGPVFALDPGASEPRVVFDPPVVRGPEWGVFDVVLAPDHAETGALLVSYSTGPEGTDPTESDVRGEVRVVRVEDGQESPIYTYEATRYHNSGRLLLHEGLLFLTRGEQNEREQAQDPANPAGNVLRMTLDGEPAPGNPFGDLTYAYGVRNPFGIAWDEERDLLVLAEVGNTENEEVNQILPGKNYGWPSCEGPCDEHESPIVWYPEVVTPTGMAVVGGDYYHGSYNYGHIFRISETDEGWTSEIYFTGSGQVVDLDRSPDGKWIYFGGFRGLFRIPTPEAGLEATRGPGVPDEEGNGTDEVVDRGPDASAPDEPNEPARLTPGPGLFVLVLAVGAAALRARR